MEVDSTASGAPSDDHGSSMNTEDQVRHFTVQFFAARSGTFENHARAEP
jgi:hypothetical protein